MRDHWARVLSLAAGAFLAASIGAVAAVPGEPQPLMPQPAAEDLNPGLSVRYYGAFFRWIDELIEWKAENEGTKGAPIPKLNYHVGGGPVLTSDLADGVGAEITGLIHLERTGTYTFLVRSNDGFRLEIGGVQILEDPNVHRDRYSEIAKLTIQRPGWYPISVLYFERKGTSTVEFYWKRPGEEAGVLYFVPSEAFAHLKEK